MSGSARRQSAVILRPGVPADAEDCGRVCYEAFKAIAEKHNFPPDFPSVEVAIGFMSMLLAHRRFYSLVAEIDGRVVGSNFLDERTSISGVGPITVDPSGQNSGVGRSLMNGVLARAAETSAAGVRLLQSAYHTRSLALYASLGFHVRETVACMQGGPIGAGLNGYRVRSAETTDIAECNRVCVQVHGHDRAGELVDAIEGGTATVVEHDRRVTGYASDTAFFGHVVGETNNDVIALLGAAKAFGGPGILVPMRNAALFRWCLENGLRVAQVTTLMSIGLYNEPDGAYLPSILY